MLLLLPSYGMAQSTLTGIIIDRNIIRPSRLSYDLAREGEKDVTDFFRIHRRNDSIAPPSLIRKERLGPFVSVLPAIGYTMESGLTGVISANISFYTAKSRHKISQVSTNADYTEFHQYWLTVNSNIYAEEQNLSFIGDYRIYKFPTVTYGLGTSSNMSDVVDIDFNYLKISQVVLREVSDNTFIGLGYHLDYHFNIREILDDSTEVTDFKNYGLYPNSTSSALSLNFLYDNRSNSINPKNGFYANIQYRYNLMFLGSDRNWQSIRIDLRKYFNIPISTENVLAFWSYNDITFKGMPPYLDLPLTGWDTYSTTGRGFVAGRYRGQKYMYLESEYRFGILRNGLLGGVVFCNAETLSEWPDNEFRIIAPAAGCGLRIKLNKHSDTNLCIDYGVGIKHSRGIYFNIGEVF